MFPALLDHVEVSGAVITADALHAQRGHAIYLAGRGAHFLFTVKRNQPGLHAQLAALPWRQVPVAKANRERGHGRAERRTLKVTAVAAGLAFPHAAQAIQIVRRRAGGKKKWSTEIGLRDHLADRHPGQPGPARRHRPRPLGKSRTGCTGSATWTTTRTAPRSAPPAAPASWPACATSPSPSCGWPARLHRRRPPPPRPPPGPPPTNDHELLNDVAGP